MKKLLAISLIISLLPACSTTAPKYSPSVKSVQAIKNSSAAPLSIGKTTVANPGLNKISLRGNSLVSPYGGYDAYLEHALKSELAAAGLLDEKSVVTVNSKITKNNLDTSMAKGFGDVSALFTVTKSGAKIFEKEVSAHEEWDSSFVGAIAIPNAMNAYPVLINTLVTNLFKDPDFIHSIAK